MYGEARQRRNVRAAIIVGAVTLLALALPVGAPLYAEVYPPPPGTGGPPPIPGIDKNALFDANVLSEFDPPRVTQFETTTLRATVIYGTSINPDLPRVEIAWSNEAELRAPDEGTFVIERTSTSRLNLSSGTRLPDGGLGLAWTWDVTPLVAGEQSLELHIIPTIIIDGKTVPDARAVNQPIPVTVDVHPVQEEFEEVRAAAEAMDTTVPEQMTVGTGHPVSASLSLAGHAETVSVDISLSAGKGSAAVTIIEEPASASAVAHRAASDDRLVRRWTVTPDEPGPVALVFTATVKGDVAAQEVDDAFLTDDVRVETTARATEPGPSLWQILQQPVQYLTPFVAFAVAVLGLWAAWKKRNSTNEEKPAGDGKAKAPAKNPAGKKAKKAKPADDEQRTAVRSGDPAP